MIIGGIYLGEEQEKEQLNYSTDFLNQYKYTK